MGTIDPEAPVYVRMVEGTSCFRTVDARRNLDGTFHLLGNPDFDPGDAYTLLEFLPGDDVRVKPRSFRSKSSPVLLATELVRSSVEDRNYWRVLFSVVWGEGSPPIAADDLRVIAERIINEFDSGVRWHYPAAVEWARLMMLDR
jgi:hypothetical protein